MSYLNINPANAPVIAQVSGSTFISTSGSVTAVVIGGSIGTGTFADVHSSIGDDAVSTSTDTLATSAYIYGFHSGNQQWARIGAQIMASGGGFGLQTSTVIRDHNIPNNKARVLNNTAFAAIATEDDALLTVSQVLGYDQTVSGYQALQVTSSGKLISGAQHKLIIDFSGAIAQIGASGSARTANVNRYGFDDGSVNDNRLLTSAALQAFNVVDNEVNRLQVLPISSGTTNTTIPTSGHPLYTASVIVDASDGFTLDIDDALESDTEPTARNRVRVQSVIQAFNEQTSGITRIRGIAVSSGMDSTPGVRMPFSGYFLGTASLIIGRDGSAINVNDPDDDSYGPNDGGLVTKSILYGYNRTENVFSRVPVTASGQGTSGMQHRLGVAFSGDVVQIGEAGNIVDVGTSMSDTMSNADNELVVRAYLAGYDLVTDQWKRILARELAFSGWAMLVSDVPTARTLDISRTTITNLSGGTVLSTFDVVGRLIIQNESGNGIMNVGGNNAGDFPHATNGFTLFAGQSIELKVDNADRVAIWAATSGQRVRVLGET